MTLVSTIIGGIVVAIVIGFITVFTGILKSNSEPQLEELPVETPTPLNHIIHFKNGEVITISKSDHLSLKEKKTFPRKMLVWDDKEANATEDTVVGYIEGVEFPWVSINSRSHGDRYYGYKNAKEI